MAKKQEQALELEKSLAGKFSLLEQLDWENDIIWDGACKDKRLKANNSWGISCWKSKVDASMREHAAAKRRQQEAERKAAEKEKERIARGPLDPKQQKAEADEARANKKAREDEAESKRCEALLKIPPNAANSLLPPEYTQLASGEWLDRVVWDDPGGDSKAAPHEDFKYVVMDLNDPGMQYGAAVEKPVYLRPRNLLQQKRGRLREATWKLREKEDDMRLKAKSLKEKGVLPPPNTEDDPFNMSSDDIYATGKKGIGAATNQFTLKKGLDSAARRDTVQHSKPANMLHESLFPSELTKTYLQNFHRPKLKKGSKKLTAIRDAKEG